MHSFLTWFLKDTFFQTSSLAAALWELAFEVFLLVSCTNFGDCMTNGAVRIEWKGTKKETCCPSDGKSMWKVYRFNFRILFRTWRDSEGLLDHSLEVISPELVFPHMGFACLLSKVPYYWLIISCSVVSRSSVSIFPGQLSQVCHIGNTLLWFVGNPYSFVPCNCSLSSTEFTIANWMLEFSLQILSAFF
jgi:hypothetical protein